MRALERRLIESLQQRFGDPESEAPTTLRDQPNEVVFTALQPKRKPEERAGVMGMGQVPTITVDEDLFRGPETVGEQTVRSMLPAQLASEQAQQQRAVPEGPPPSIGAGQGPPQAQQQAQAAPEESLQDLLVTG